MMERVAVTLITLICDFLGLSYSTAIKSTLLLCVLLFLVFPFVRTGKGTLCVFTEKTFKNRLLLLKRYVDENESLQLEILYASQVAVTRLKHPPSKGRNKNKIQCYFCRYFNCFPPLFLSGATPDLHITLRCPSRVGVCVQSVEGWRLGGVRKRRISTSFQCVLQVAWNSCSVSHGRSRVGEENCRHYSGAGGNQGFPR